MKIGNAFNRICGPKKKCVADVLEQTIQLAVEIAREGREGRKIGTLFVVSDEKEVLKRSRPLILDPLYGHPIDRKKIYDPNMRETVKELAQLDGAFIVSGDGVVISAARYINASSRRIELPLGLGSRHVAAASISRDTQAVAVVVSESSVVRVFNEGQLIAEIIPEIWLFGNEGFKIPGPHEEQKIADLRIVSIKTGQKLKPDDIKGSAGVDFARDN
ncbi:MAG: diadenylate cyclase [Thermodesulfobacteriota bacterium]|nr:diadenylate cyclase [Thermodesulfobacteriota bacterium]